MREHVLMPSYTAHEDGTYCVPSPLPLHDLVHITTDILRQQFVAGEVFQNPRDVSAFLVMQMARLECEVFACMFLNTRNRLLHYEHMFRGTLRQTSVHPREILKQALKCNAAGVILAHNHPGGSTEPSKADMLLTENIKNALTFVDVTVVDHIIVGANCETVSFSERGLL